MARGDVTVGKIFIALFAVGLAAPLSCGDPGASRPLPVRDGGGRVDVGGGRDVAGGEAPTGTDVSPRVDGVVTPDGQPDGQADQPGCATTDDVAHCGACFNVCPGPTEGAGAAACVNKVCSIDCGALTRCGTACVDTANDGRHCGGCNMACGAGMVCRMGRCAVNCAPGLSVCGNVCANLTTDVNNCRICGESCPAPTAGTGSAVCTPAGCDISCSGGTSKCGTTCVNLQTTVSHCGSCNNSCSAPISGSGSAVCSSGVCTLACAAGLTNCSGACVNSSSDRANCGACGRVCDANATCGNGGGAVNCACNTGYTGTGVTCAAEDECVTGTHRCGGIGGTCTGGAGVGYTCTCRNGFTLSSGSFPKCYRSGVVTFGGDRLTGVWGYDFMAGMPLDYNNFHLGDFYASDSDDFHTLWANNAVQRGVQRVTSSAPLLDVPIPATGYTRQGVPVVNGGTYVSLAKTPDTDYYIVFRVTARPATGFTMSWVLVYRS